MSIDPWIALWLSYGILILSVVVTLFVPETMSLSQATAQRQRISRSESEDKDTTDEEQKEIKLSTCGWLLKQLHAARSDTNNVLRFIFASKGIAILLVAHGAAIFVQYNILINLLQYMTKRFNWDWSTANLPQRRFALSKEQRLIVYLGNICIYDQMLCLGRRFINSLTDRICSLDKSLQILSFAPRHGTQSHDDCAGRHRSQNYCCGG